MADDINRRKPMSAEEVLRTELIINQALIDILITKQFITEEELVVSIRNIKHEQEKILKKPNKIISFKR
jgi:hypothetical protein